jgi:hypothetical protein
VARDPQAIRVGQNLRGALAAVKAELAMEIAANLREAVPVDTGHARANILPGLDGQFTDETSDAGAYDAGVAAIIGAPPEAELVVTCNVPYWPRLVNGSSQQAPAGFDLVAIDTAIATVEGRHDGLSIDVSGSDVSARGAGAAAGMAAAYSPFGDE